LPCAVATPFAHDAERHVVVGPTKPVHDFRVTPSQLAARQGSLADAAAHAARPFAGAPSTGTHVPDSPATLHASHCPSHAALQQTPSAQNAPAGHASTFEHAAPSASRGLHEPEAQYAVATQSELVAHATTHLPVCALQAKGAQSVLPTALPHVPRPVQKVPTEWSCMHVEPLPQDVLGR
jgi:hypothetical protein